MKASLSFVELVVKDLGRSLQWYCDWLGLTEVMRDGERFALLDGGAKLALKKGDPVPGSIRLAFQVTELETWITRLQVAGVSLEGEVKESDEGYRRVRLRDPDRYAVILYEYGKRSSADTVIA